MKFTLSWLKEHLETDWPLERLAGTMTMAGLEVERVSDPAARLQPFSVAKIVQAARHPNADRLQVCQVETRDGLKEIVCGAANARAGLTTVYAPIGALVPGSGITLARKPVRGIVSDGMLCSAKELEISEDGEGILELDDALEVGTPLAAAFASDPVIDFEVTPNRSDWLGVAGIARDLSAVGAGRLITPAVASVAGGFACPIEIRSLDPDACPHFVGRLIRGVRNGPSPDWLQQRLRAIGLRPISALVDVTNLLAYDRDRPLHVYDADKISGGFLEARLGRPGERLQALDGRDYEIGPQMCVIADASGAVGLGGVMGGDSTGCSHATTSVFIESAYFDPLRTAQTGRDAGTLSDAQYRFARGVDSGFTRAGLELATAWILRLCGGEASQVAEAGAPPPPPAALPFDPAAVRRLSGLDLSAGDVETILADLGFEVNAAQTPWRVLPPTWRRDVEGPADLVEEAARIAGYDRLPRTPLPPTPYRSGGVLTPRQARVRTGRRALAALGYQETLGWSFTSKANAGLFGGGGGDLVLANPIASELDCMRPSCLPGLVESVGRNRARGFADLALFEIGPVFRGPNPEDQRTALAAILASDPPKSWSGEAADPLFQIKADLMVLLSELGAPVGSLQIVQTEPNPWWRPGRAARLQLGPKTVVAEFGALHPRVLKALDVSGPLFGFELSLETLPETKRRLKARAPLDLSPLMPLTRDFAFIVDKARPAGEVIRAVQGADKTLIASVHVFDVYQGERVGEGEKSVALQVTIQPRERTLTDEEIEALSGRIVSAAQKACGARLRS